MEQTKPSCWFRCPTDSFNKFKYTITSETVTSMISLFYICKNDNFKRIRSEIIYVNQHAIGSLGRLNTCSFSIEI